jgi:hypothetical protein
MLSGPPTQPEPSLLIGTRQLEEAFPEMRQHDFGFGRDYAYRQEQARALEDAVQMQALAVAQQYSDTRFHNVFRQPEVYGIEDTIHHAATEPLALDNGQLALGYHSSGSSSRGSRRRSIDRYNMSSEPSGGEADSEGSIDR